MNPNSLGRRLRAVRKSRGLTRREVADTLGLPRTAVTRIEAGRRSVSTLELSRLARIYHRPTACFLEETEEDADPGEDLLAALRSVEPGWMNDRKIRERANRCVNLCLEGIAMRRVLGLTPRPGPLNYKMNIPGPTGESASQLRQSAAREKCLTGAGKDMKPDVDELESWEELAEKYLSASEPAGNSDWGLHDEIAHLAVEAYRRGTISRGRLLDLGAILEMQEETLLDLAEGACGN